MCVEWSRIHLQTIGCSVANKTKHFKLKALFYSLRNHVMKIMTTNHISDKCIFPYVNNKGSHNGLLLVLGVCFVSPLPVVLSYYKNVYKAFFQRLFPKKSTQENKFHTIFVCEGELHVYTRFSLLCYAS